MSFVFYDLETSGLEKPFDQIFQFGAIFADDDLNIIDKLDIRCNRSPEVVPSPQALLVTKVSPSQIASQAFSHYELIREVLKWLSDKQPSSFIGHNSMDFDENFMRFAFYKTLHDPYLTQIGGNRRGDTLLMCHAAHHHAAGKLVVPESNGKLSFRLGPIARANGIDFPEEAAHDAFADIQATLELAKLIREQTPEIWEVMEKHMTPADVKASLEAHSYMYFSAVFFGKPSSFVVSKAASSVENDNEVAVFDLANDPAPYLDMEVHELIDALSDRKRPFRILKANRLPILFPKELPSPYLKSEKLADEIYEERAAQLKANKGFQQRLSEALPQRYEPKEPSGFVEEQLYDSLFFPEDKELLDEFHMAPWEKRPAIVEKLSDGRLRELGNRLICIEAPGHADSETLAIFEQWVEYRLTTKDSVSWFTLDKALQEIDDIGEPTDPAEKALLAEIRAFLLQLAGDSVT